MEILLHKTVTNIQPSIFTETEELSLLNQFENNWTKEEQGRSIPLT